MVGLGLFGHLTLVCLRKEDRVESSVVKVTCSLFRVNFPCKLSFVPTITTILCEWVFNSLTVCLPWLTP